VRRQHEALLREPDVPGDRADDSPDEEVEDDEEGDLEPEQNRFDLDGGDGQTITSDV
jgi:hypothetical protein